MQDRVGEDFHAVVLSCTKYGFFVELDDLFIEGLVPLETIARSLPFADPDRYSFRDTDRHHRRRPHSGRVFKSGPCASTSCSTASTALPAACSSR